MYKFTKFIESIDVEGNDIKSLITSESNGYFIGIFTSNMKFFVLDKNFNEVYLEDLFINDSINPNIDLILNKLKINLNLKDLHSYQDMDDLKLSVDIKIKFYELTKKLKV